MSQKYQSEFHAGLTQKILTITKNQPISVNTSVSCPLCNQAHSIHKCPRSIEKSPNDGLQLMKIHRLCLNCLGTGHASATFQSINVKVVSNPKFVTAF